jgi:hypothetical protein
MTGLLTGLYASPSYVASANQEEPTFSIPNKQASYVHSTVWQVKAWAQV